MAAAGRDGRAAVASGRNPAERLHVDDLAMELEPPRSQSGTGRPSGPVRLAG